jgi:hypothetical protein
MVEPNLEPNAVDSVTVAEPMCAKVITLAELGRVAVAKVRARNIKLLRRGTAVAITSLG